MSKAAVKNDEPLKKWRKRLIFRSNHRGTKEMDLIMGSFADQNVEAFDEGQLQEYEDILTQNDPNLYNWLTDKEKPPENISGLGIFKLLQQHKYI